MNWAEYSKIIFEKCKQSEKPYQACFELTPFCNFKCNMCYVRLSPEQALVQGNALSTRQWLQIAEETKKMGTLHLEVTGGEATTRPDFCTLYAAFIKMGYLIHLRTNGYLVYGNMLELLKKYKPRKISVTLYGASDETYQKVCGISDGFSVVTRNVLAMKAAGLNIRLSMTVTNDNEKDKPLLEKWARDNGLSIDSFGALITPIRGAKRSIDHLQVKYADEEFEVPDEVKAIPYTVSDRESYMKPFWLCRGFGALFCISWDGRMTLCNTFTEVWEDPLKKGVETAYHDLYAKLRSLKRPKECASCQYIEFCAACPSRLQSATGNAEQTCEEVCKFAKRKYKYYLLMERKKQEINKDVVGLDCNEGEGILED